ncbi:MAG: hypothetical protein AAF500_21945 [Myxococcota bacterium]
MKAQHLTLGITLALATSACTGLGVQTGPTLTSEIAQEQGLGNLWGEQAAPVASVPSEIDYRDDAALADLWVEGQEPVAESGNEAPRAVSFLERVTLTDSVFGSDADRSEVLPK